MDDFNSETDSDYTSYWRDWVRTLAPLQLNPSSRALATRYNFPLLSCPNPPQFGDA